MNKLIETDPTNNEGISTLFYIIGTVTLVSLFLFVPISDIPKWVIGIWGALAAIFFYIGASFASNERPTKCYMDVNGNFDLKSSRKYESKKINSFRALLGSPWIFQQGMQIASFSYADGKVCIITRNGKKIECPLKNLEVVIYDCTKGMDAVVLILKNEGKSIKITHNTLLFEQEEIEDINCILSYSGKVEEATISKVNKNLVKVKDMIDDNPASSTVVLNMKAVNMLKQKTIDRSLDKSGEVIDKTSSFLEDELRKAEEKNNPKSELQIATDSKIEHLLKETRNISQINDDVISDLIVNSSDDGRKHLFLAYEDQANKESLTSDDESILMKAIYPLECFMHWAKNCIEDIETMIMIKIFLIITCISIPIFKFDQLGGWNILLGCVLLGVWGYISNVYLNKLTKSFKSVKDSIGTERERIIKTSKETFNSLQNDGKTNEIIEKESKYLKQKYTKEKRTCWTLTVCVLIILTIFLYVPF